MSTLAQAKGYVDEAKSLGVSFAGKVGDLGCGYNDAEQVVPITHVLLENYKLDPKDIVAVEYDEATGLQASSQAKYRGVQFHVGPDKGDVTKVKYNVSTAFLAAILLKFNALGPALDIQESRQVVVYGFDQWTEVMKDQVEQILKRYGYVVTAGNNVVVGKREDTK